MEITAFADLLDLQDVDLQIDRLIDRRQHLPELERYRTVNADRIAAEESHKGYADALRVIDLELDKAEGELEILEGRLSEAETRLFAGGMNARETEHKRLEVRSLGGQKETMEERVLGLLDRRDESEATVTAARAELDALADQERELEATITQQWKEIDLEIGRREATKAEIVLSIPPDLLEMYEQLRRTKQGVAIGRLEDGQCLGCHLSLSAAERAEAAAADPPRCVHCRRLLVI